MATDNPVLLKAAAGNSDITVSSKLKAVEDALAVSVVSTEELREQTKKNVETTKEATGKLTSAIKDVTSANQITERARLNADLQQQTANQAVLETGGGQENQVKLLSTLREDSEDVEALLNEKTDIMNDEPTGFFPIDLIINAFRTIPTSVQLKNKQRELVATRQQISDITGAQEAFAIVNVHTKKTLSEGVIEANMKRISAEGRIAATEQELKNLHSNSSAMTALATADSSTVSNRLAVFRLEGEAETRALKLEDQSFRREQIKFEREQWPTRKATAETNLKSAQLRLEDAKLLTSDRRNAARANFQSATKKFNDAQLFQEDAVNAVHRSQAAVGLPLETPETIMFKMFNGPTQAKYVRMHELGAVERPVLGLNPFEATSNLRLIDSSGVSSRTKYTRLLDDAAQIQLDRYNKTGASVPKNKEQIEADYNKAAEDLMTVHTNEIKQGDNTNPLHAPPFQTLATKRSVAETALYQKVLKDKGMVETNAQTIVDSALAGVLARAITMEEAAVGIEAIYEAAALHNNKDMGGFERVGLPSQTTYNVRLDRDPSAFEVVTILPALANPFTLPGKVLASGAPTAGEFLQDQVDAYWTADLMDITDVKQLLVGIRSSIKPETEEERQAAIAKQEQTDIRKGTIGDERQ